MNQEQQKPDKSWLEDRLVTLENLYKKFGRDGLREQSTEDVSLLLSSKELLLRDSPKGHGISEAQQANNRRLELEIRDLSSFLHLRLSVADAYGRAHGGLARTVAPRQHEHTQQQRRGLRP